MKCPFKNDNIPQGENTPLAFGRDVRRSGLVSADWAAARIADDPGFVLVHVGYEGEAGYRAAHLPGAVYLDTLQLESPEDWNRRPREVVRAVCASLGIRSDTTVVLYGRDLPPGEGHIGKYAGQLAAFRAAAILIDAGAADVRVLDGGFEAWEGVVESGWVEPRALADFGEPGDTPQVFVDLAEVQEILEDGGWALVDVRSRAEYDGETSGYDYFEARGHIPGAVWVGDDFRGPAGELRPLAEIEAGWAALGITGEKRIAFYCGTGWRAAEAWYAAWHLGWEACVYDGGWFGWSGSAADRPPGPGGR